MVDIAEKRQTSYSLKKHNVRRQVTNVVIGAAVLAFVCIHRLDSKNILMSTIQSNSPGTIVKLGSDYGGWTYDDSMDIDAVYSFGLGEDTSWDEAMLQKHTKAQLFGFDPTPKSIQYVSQRVKEAHFPSDDRFHHIAEGLTGKEGHKTLTFTMPSNPDHVSMRENGGNSNIRGGSSRTVEVKVDTLQSFMKRNKHTHISILKMDVEGSELDILEGLLDQNYLPFSQLLVEWHSRFGGGLWSKYQRWQRKRSIVNRLKKQNFEVVHQQNSGQEMTFVRQDAKKIPTLLKA